MNDREAKRWVLIAMVVAGVTTTGTSLVQHGRLPSVRLPIGIFVAGLMLALAAEIAPQVAGPLAILIVLSTLLSGGTVWTALVDVLD